MKQIRSKKYKKHGMSYAATYVSWTKMKSRCYTKSSTEYKSHGERGIIVCDSWKDSFINFLNDMGVNPGKGYSIDRINNDGNYEPKNCRWATNYQQCRNKRSNVWLTLKGKTMCIKDWGNELGIDYRTISKRLKLGWSQEKALTTTLRKKSLH